MKEMQSFLMFFYILDQCYDQCPENDLGGFLGSISPELWEDGKPMDEAVYNDWKDRNDASLLNSQNIDFVGRCPQRLCVFQHNLFNLHTFRPWSYWLIWGEIPLFHIGSTSQNTCFMVHLSEPGLKTGTQAVTVRHRAKRW